MEIGMRVFNLIQIAILSVLRLILRLLQPEKPPTIPPATNPLVTLTVIELAEKIRNKEITSQAVVEAYIGRIKLANTYVNAVIEDRFEAAIIDAKICDNKLRSGEVTASRLKKEKPLYGIPLTVKESCGIKGLSQTGCTYVRRNIKASADSSVVELLKNAGAIPLCVTNTPELCLGYDSHNLLFGRTCNPYDGRCVAGGSSGGEAALLGAGASIIGVGSDLAGSLRIPALFNGIFAHKPSPDVIPIKGHFPMSDSPEFQRYLVLGPMARYAEDLHLTMKVMSANCARDLRLDEPVDVAKLRVFYLQEAGKYFGLERPAPEIRQSVKKAANYLADRGAIMQQLPFFLSDSVDAILAMLLGIEDMPQMLINPDDPKHEKSAVCESVKSIFGLSQYTKWSIYMKLLTDTNLLIPASRMPRHKATAAALRQKFIELLGEDGVFLYPTFIGPAVHWTVIALQTLSGMYCTLCNISGFPATHVPMGLNADGLPIGIQVIAAPDQDRLCLAVAKELEKQFGGWVPPPPTGSRKCDT